MKRPLTVIIFLLYAILAVAQNTEIVVLDNSEINNLRMLAGSNARVRMHCDSIVALAGQHRYSTPQPVARIFYEGLLDNDPGRIATTKSLEDMDKVVDFIYASYCQTSHEWALKAKEFVLAWVANYIPTGNPINENKLTALFWAYHLFSAGFSDEERQLTEGWMQAIAEAQMERKSTPNNNWEAKRLKIIGTVGCINGNAMMKEYAVRGLKTYIGTAYYSDGTSNDLRQRDALHYHIGGLKPAVAVFVTLAPYDPHFDLYPYVSPEGSSIRKSVEYTWPYASGEKQRGEWANSKVRIDKERAAAGLAKYQPGILFDPKAAVPLFEWACYYNPAWYALFGCAQMECNYTATWTGLLNSPLVRNYKKFE